MQKHYSKKFQKDQPKKDWIRLHSQGRFLRVARCFLVLVFFAKNKRQKKDWGLLHSSAEKCWKWKKRLNLASEWRLFDSQSKNEEISNQKTEKSPEWYFFHSNLVQKGHVVWKKKIKSIQNAGLSTSSGEIGKFTVEHKRTENSPTKKMTRKSFFWWKRKNHSWKKKIENLFNRKK